MAHWSEGDSRLDLETIQVSRLEEIASLSDKESPAVHLFRFPAGRTDHDAAFSQSAFQRLALYCETLHSQSTVCILTTPPDAARLLPYLEHSLKFQLWIAVKINQGVYPALPGTIPERHAALLVLTRYHGSLNHTKTRIQYTYCPECGKSTKDYGGKKHVYHEYGTLMSDVWRDIPCNPSADIEAVLDRLRDLFGLAPYEKLQMIDLRSCVELATERPLTGVHESRLPIEWDRPELPKESQLLNLDCLEALRSLSNDSVDFCFADPPYNLEKKYDHWDDALETRDYFAWCDSWLTELARVLKPGRTLAVINIPLWVVRHYKHLSSLLEFQTWIAWEALGFPVRMIMPAHYAVLCFSKGSPRRLPAFRETGTFIEEEDLSALKECYCVRAGCLAQRRRAGRQDREAVGNLWHDIHRLKHNTRRVDHPCQLPPLLMRRLFALFTQPDETVLDCFNGAGTSTLAAHQMSRRFIGIELSSTYHEIALERHAQVARGEDPFGKQEQVPKAKNSRVERLPKQKYIISKKTLQLEVKRIAHQLGHLPSREDVAALSRHPIEYYDRYFISWGEVCAAARTTGMSELPPTASDRPPQPQLELDVLT